MLVQADQQAKSIGFRLIHAALPLHGKARDGPGSAPLALEPERERPWEAHAQPKPQKRAWPKRERRARRAHPRGRTARPRELHAPTAEHSHLHGTRRLV